MAVLTKALLGLTLAAGSAAAQAQIQITEWMYNGANETGEYVEIANLGSSAVDFSGWSFDDNSRTPGSVSLSAFGSVAPGESVVLTEATAVAFRSAWGLGAGVKIVGGNTNNLGRADEINVYDAGGLLVDRLTYGDVALPGTVQTLNRSGNPRTLADLVPQAVTPTGWVLASNGDGYRSVASAFGDVGSPGVFALPVPEPSSWALLLAGIGAVGALARRRTV